MAVPGPYYEDLRGVSNEGNEKERAADEEATEDSPHARVVVDVQDSVSPTILIRSMSSFGNHGAWPVHTLSATPNWHDAGQDLVQGGRLSSGLPPRLSRRFPP